MQSKDYEKFIESQKSANTARVVSSLNELGGYDYTDCTFTDLEQIILKMNPKSPKEISTITYVLGLYAKFLGDEKLYQRVINLNKKSLWKKAKPTAAPKFISNETFKRIYEEIGAMEEFNSLYFQTLFRCIYEGVYCDDMSVIKNLRSSDIAGTSITLRKDNGNIHVLEISEELAENLKELATINTWERKNRYNSYKIQTTGVYYDCCFKVESRNGAAENAYRYTYYRLLRKISTDYLQYSLLPLQLYVSGIMYRIRVELEKQYITLDEAFAEHNRDKLVLKIIKDELDRSNYNITVGNFRQIVSGHIDVFNN